tara:strand:- start:169 stop:459 length:291 start_codon:yes stop_codon:yes gene_type:complete
MKTSYVINPKNIPVRLPFKETLLWYIILDYLQMPEWLWGVVGFVMLAKWVGAVYVTFHEEKLPEIKPADIKKPDKSRFQEKLTEAMKSAKTSSKES